MTAYVDWIDLVEVRTECIVGILPRERVTPQPLDLVLSLGLDLTDAGTTGDLARSLDYAAVCDQVLFLVRSGHWRLLETIAVVVGRHLLAPPAPSARHARPQRVRLLLRKPEILGDKGVAGIRFERDVGWYDLRPARLQDGVTAEALVEVEEASAYRVHLDTGAVWRPSRPLALHSLAGEVITESPFDADGHVVMADEPIANRSRHVASLLAVARTVGV